jgi:hypothetical protein
MMIFMGGGPGPGGAASGPWFMWRRGLTVSGSYGWGRNRDNTDGAFAVPASAKLDDERGPSMFDRRHNGHFSVTSSAVRNLTARLGINGSSAPPLTIRTGPDDNGDLVFNDRPAGVGRNSARTIRSGTRRRASRPCPGKKQVTSGGGVQIMDPAGLTVN